MTQVHHLQLPVDEAAVRGLHVGDLVTLTGDIIVTAGLPTHERILEYLDRGEELPMNLRGGTLLHLGSYSRDAGDKLEVLYMNPTTSTRFNPTSRATGSTRARARVAKPRRCFQGTIE